MSSSKQVVIYTAAAAIKSKKPPAAVSTNDGVKKKHTDEFEVLEERVPAEDSRLLPRNLVWRNCGKKCGNRRRLEAAITAAKAELEKVHEKDIEKTIERSRVEQQAKRRLEDAQLMRTQVTIKELEVKVLELRGSDAASTSNTAAAVPEARPGPSTRTETHSRQNSRSEVHSRC